MANARAKAKNIQSCTVAQHEHRAQQGEEEELHRRVDPPGAAPDADDEIHGDEHQLPEDVEEEHVQGHEGAQHPHLEKLHGKHESPDPLLDRLVGGEYRDGGQKGGHHHQKQADPVDAQVISHPQALDPFPLFDQLHSGPVGIEQEEQNQRQGQIQKRHAQGQVARDLGLAPGHQQYQQGAQQGQPQH
jgi:hypothetical protein